MIFYDGNTWTEPNKVLIPKKNGKKFLKFERIKLDIEGLILEARNGKLSNIH